MGNSVTYKMKTALGAIGACLLLGCLVSCGSYKELDIDVLKPGGINLGNGDAQIMFIDRKIIHVSDSLAAPQLYSSLRLRRDNLVTCFYDGLRDGLRNGIRPVLLVRGLGLKPTYITDGMEPEPISPEGIKALEKTSRMTHVLAVEYCKFNLDFSGRLVLDDNLFVRLYDANGQVVDSMNSQKMEVKHSTYEGEDDYATICNFFYDKGWSYAERLTPMWTPERRRLYTDNRVLSVGYHFFQNGDMNEARRIWEAALALKPNVAAKAAVNLAWLYEKDGNFSGAKALLEAAEKTLQKANISNKVSVYIKEYIEVLDRRIKDETKIMEQI
ncbi:tetratricopeptide repeat protein [Butyricimonas synergistica]|uniref:tetratricopeptide repeat protein n=1 Tax=Butyricimonas synergistica TaxID=544644 RepID=UPI00039EDB49|nr:DUF6340 family protein [Butyricimonas synergistica]